ncbi:MAG: hypothetical protein MUF59_02280 [Candidatus Krumholzibacteria bacterium]|nr:hypothetical protein [Candidatus Krumholzibacteria bacterium]
MKRFLAAITYLIATASAGCGLNVAALTEADPFLCYTVVMKDPALDLVSVTGSVYGSLDGKVPFTAANPGGGRLLEPLGLAARDLSGRPLEITADGVSWIVRNEGRDFTFSYDVVLSIGDRYTPEIRGMLSMIGADRSRLMGRDIFLLPGTLFSEGILVDIDTGHEGGLHSTWECTGGRIIVPEVADLASTLAVSGAYRELEAEVSGTRLSLAIAGEWLFTDEDLFRVVREVVSLEISMFGSSPHGKHLFVCEPNPVRGPGVFDYYGVHFAGSMLLLLDPAMDGSLLFDTPMAVVAHEFFHNWNGEALQPSDESFMWFTEGATVYYSYRVLVDSGVIAGDQYERQAENIRRRYLDNPYLADIAIGEAANRDLSDRGMVNLLYDGGFLAAEALDREISEATSGRVSLIDVLRSLYERHPGGATIDEEVLRLAVIELTGRDIGPLVSELVHSKAPEMLSASRLSS